SGARGRGAGLVGGVRRGVARPPPPSRCPPPAGLAAGPGLPRAAPAGAGAGSKGGPDRPPAAGRQVAPDQAPDPGSPGEAPGLGAGASPPLGPSGTPGTTVQPSELRRLTGPILERCLEAASTLRLAAPGDPAAYRIARMALALDTGRAPPATSGTRTAVPAPSASQVRELEAWAARGDFASLLDAAEGALRSHRFWLDLHRYAAIALAGLGVDYRAARAEVLSGCAYLAVRYPELLELTFRDGLPFASEATRAWIEAEVLPGAARRGAAAEPSPGLGRDGDLAAARRALVSGDRDHALRLLAELTRAAEGGRSRFRARLELARALATGSTVDAAEGLLEGLGRRIDQLGLEAWEPELAAEVYRVHLVCLSRSARPADPALARRRSAVRRRLCGVEPMTTLAATPRGR
ncbi:MAG: type VI secretion system domain-containing protein, partial [Sandaracinaceae bacterium]